MLFVSSFCLFLFTRLIAVCSYKIYKHEVSVKINFPYIDTRLHAVDKSKSVETFIKVKRLRQILAEGKTYRSYVTEMSRYGNASNINISTMENVLRYKNNVTRAELTPTVADTILKMYQVAFLPDHGAYEAKRWFYPPFLGYNHSMNLYNITPIAMPNVNDYNTKRFEQLWLNYMRQQQLSLFDVVIGHGTSAEALLRYMESEPIKRAIIIDGTDMYTAGERHGRAFLYSRIGSNCHAVSLISISKDNMNEARVLCQELKAEQFVLTTTALESFSSSLEGSVANSKNTQLDTQSTTVKDKNKQADISAAEVTKLIYAALKNILAPTLTGCD